MRWLDGITDSMDPECSRISKSHRRHPWLPLEILVHPAVSRGKATVPVQLLSRVRLFATPWTAARQASLSITISWSLLKLMSIASVMPSNHLILCRPLLLLPSIFPSPAELGQESQASSCLRKGTPLASRVAQGVSGPSSSCVWNPRHKTFSIPYGKSLPTCLTG